MTYNRDRNPASKHWERAIILVDMNTFFSSIEQLDNPAWQNRPVSMTNSLDVKQIVDCSREARAKGIRDGMLVKDAKRLCPDLIQVSTRPNRYAEVSSDIIRALKKITSDIEVVSIHKVFLDITKVQNLFGPPEVIARLVQQTIHQASRGLPCTIGLSGDKTTAQHAVQQSNGNGLTIVPPWLSEERLKNVLVTELHGVSKRIGLFLARHGVNRCSDMKKLSIKVLERHFGERGRQIWYMTQGIDPEPVKCNTQTVKSIGEGKVISSTTDPDIVNMHLIQLCETVSSKLRNSQLETNRLLIALRLENGDWIGDRYQTNIPCDDANIFMQLGKQLLREQWNGKGISQIQVTALNPQISLQQKNVISHTNKKRATSLTNLDHANNHYREPSNTRWCRNAQTAAF